MMIRIEKWKTFLKELSSDHRVRLFFVSVFCFGILAHGMMMFNKYSFGDDSWLLFSIGSLIDVGRWMLGIIGKLYGLIFRNNYSLPLLHVFWTMVFTGLSGTVIIRALDLKNRWSIICLAAVMIAIPSVTGTFGYLFTSAYYALAAFLALLSSVMLFRAENLRQMFAADVLLCCTIGIYQAEAGLAISFLLILLLKHCLEDNLNSRAFWKKAGILLGNLLISAILYAGITILFLKAAHMTMSAHAGLDQLSGSVGFSLVLTRILQAYQEFILPSAMASTNMYPGNIRILYELLLILIVLMLGRELRNTRNRSLYLEVFLFLLVFPPAVKLMFLLTDAAYVHSLMMYADIMVFVLAMTLMERVSGSLIRKASVVLLALISFMYVRYDNVVYLKTEVQQSQAVSYYNSLITRIRSVQGYTDDTPVCWIGSLKEVSDGTISDYPEFREVITTPYDEVMIRDYAWNYMMKLWCGFDPETVPEEAFSDRKEVQTMPSYPDDGSIRMIDGTIVVKCSEEGD